MDTEAEEIQSSPRFFPVSFLDNEELTGENSRKLRKALDEFDTYVVVNEALIPNYGER